MCRIMEEMAKEERLEERLEMAAKILESGKMTEEELSAMFKLTAKQMHAIKEKSCCSGLIIMIHTFVLEIFIFLHNEKKDDFFTFLIYN